MIKLSNFSINTYYFYLKDDKYAKVMGVCPLFTGRYTDSALGNIRDGAA
ncbi:hypothetical protein PAT3040_05388 [Paenibacillus agaridevorans]|uniref:Uncharacterized protein n=1 Tax=Paenibacillus agaridevorans TaxID=171404 RepID=A0A2R5EVQ4_9BACL|nr:hypothetical protein PAT3040_05388 [Paenibacillus agaridevorans]